MHKTILISPNSFKESSNSVKIANYFNKFLPGSFNKIIKPISDGGDGFLDVCRFYYGGKLIEYEISTPYSEEGFKCEVLYNPEKKKIFIESASVLGLKIISADKRDPMNLSSIGLGELLVLVKNDVERKELEVSEIVIGVGGTSTIDMGIGTCSQLGLKLFGSANNIVKPIPKNFIKVKSIISDVHNLPFSIDCIVDVNTQLLGMNGAIHIYGPQKGINLTDIELIKKGLYNFVNILKNNKLFNSYKVLNGAGGGLACGLEIFLKAKLIQAKDFITWNISDTNQDEIDYIITGEGAFDLQSFEGKGASVIIDKFRNTAKQIFLVCGKVDVSIIPRLPQNLKVIELSEFFNSKEESVKNIKEGIKLASIEIIKHIEK